MIRFLTAGESHGKGLTTIVEGFPSNIPLTAGFINEQLKRRQKGFGRGARMKIESDTAEILSGVRNGKTTGAPISLYIQNKDWVNWKDIMNTEPGNLDEAISIPRPGHADLNGTLKYNYNDIRNSIERASARETAARVAACSIALKLLDEFGIQVASFVESIGGVYSSEDYFNTLLENRVPQSLSARKISAMADKSSVRVLDPNHEKKIINKIKSAQKQGNTLGGTFVVFATGLPAGLGSFMHYDRKIDAEIASAILSINAVKGIEIGNGFAAAEKYGSEVHDEIEIKNKKFVRRTNRSGGIEGGITTGMPIILRASMKPISTLLQPLFSVDLKTMKKMKSRFERSDFVAVPSCSVIAEAMLGWVVAKYFIEKFGGDSIEETKNNYSNYSMNLFDNTKQNFKKR
ncbi:MAG TPA: chorismate synthase [Ignavibacteriaceae bacterium]|nr:chorismate synthase [Ignavibacteriaceae bacterium]